MFSGEDAMLFKQWKHQFTSWLCFGDGRYSEDLDHLEAKSEVPPLSSYNADERQMSQKLFAVLTSYLRGKRAHMVRAAAKNKDRFRLWHSLNQEYMPSTRQRSLVLAQALGAYPPFSKNKSTLESVLNFEQLVMQYEEARSSVYPKELMAAMLIRCCQPKLREQLKLSINDDTSYRDIRDKITAYERVAKTWASDQVLKHVNDQPNYASGAQNDGPVPMEVDRAEKGKGKQKGKGKNKGFPGGEWASSWLYGRGRPKLLMFFLYSVFCFASARLRNSKDMGQNVNSAPVDVGIAKKNHAPGHSRLCAASNQVVCSGNLLLSLQPKLQATQL